MQAGGLEAASNRLDKLLTDAFKPSSALEPRTHLLDSRREPGTFQRASEYNHIGDVAIRFRSDH